MSVREYIGARYVPLFADPIEWDNTKTYEPLTIVYYQGNSYTSRQAVPTGIAITNEDYWALTGNYNAQIEAYRAEVQEFADDIGELNAALPITTFDENNTVEDAIDEVDGRIDTIEANGWVTTQRLSDSAVTSSKLADSSVITSKIGDGQVSKSKLGASVSSVNTKPKLALYIGNSFVLGTGATDDKGGIFDRTKDLFDEAHYYWDDGIGFDPYNNHGSSQTFSAQLQLAKADTRFAASAVTDVFFVSAMGDTRAVCEQSNFVNLQSTIADAKASFPNATVHIYFAEITGSKNVQSAYSVLYPIAQLRVHLIFEYYAPIYGYDYMGWGGWNINFDNYYTVDDKYHPNNAGYIALSEFFKEAYKGNIQYQPKLGTISRTGYTSVSYKMFDPLHGTCKMPNLSASSYSSFTGNTAISIAQTFNPLDTTVHPVFYPALINVDKMFATYLNANNTNRFSVGKYESVVSTATGNVNVNMTPRQSTSSGDVNVAEYFGSGFIAPIDMWINADLTVS